MKELEFSQLSPITKIKHPLTQSLDIKLLIKRDDLNHPQLEGNKFRKLKYNLIEARTRGIKKLVSCGGAYSNHLYALSSAGKIFGFETVGLVRGKHADLSNPTLSACLLNGMKIHLLTSEEYVEQVKIFQDQSLDMECMFLPEGGANELALKGVGELYDEILYQEPSVTDIVLPCGTGTTYAGLLKANSKKIAITGIPVLKMNMRSHLESQFQQIDFSQGGFIQDAHMGGYAKFKPPLISFIRNFYDEYKIVLDPIYNGKGLFALIESIENGHFRQGSVIVYIHTGGSQGIAGFNARYGLDLPVN